MSIVKDHIVPDTAICTPYTSIENIKNLMKEVGREELVVVDTILEKHLVGRINGNTISQLSVHKSVLPSQLNAEACMESFPVTVEADSSFEEGIRLMDEYHLENIPVVDGFGHYVGFLNRNQSEGGVQ